MTEISFALLKVALLLSVTFVNNRNGEFSLMFLRYVEVADVEWWSDGVVF